MAKTKPIKSAIDYSHKMTFTAFCCDVEKMHLYNPTAEKIVFMLRSLSWYAYMNPAFRGNYQNVLEAYDKYYYDR